jgi:hypothetical protein
VKLGLNQDFQEIFPKISNSSIFGGHYARSSHWFESGLTGFIGLSRIKKVVICWKVSLK